jgi:predicted metal-binding membrane protein
MYSMADSMGMNLTGGMRPDGRMSWFMDGFAVLFPMWAIMMAAMMGPTFVPTLRTYQDLVVQRIGSRSGFVMLIVGYGLAWLTFAFLIAWAHQYLVSARFLDMMGQSVNTLLSSALLVLIGLFQFTPVKDRCLEVCRSPMGYFLSNWNPGAIGGLRLGLGIGVYCVVCCWGLMALGFVLGAMNLLWMGAATLFMVLEKLPDLAQFTTRPLGIAFVIWGISLIVSPLLGM